MNSITLLTITITCIISYQALNDIRLFEKYKFNVAAITNRKEYVRLISAGFLHADFTHLFLNMFTLFFFAPLVIENFGNIGFLLIYLGSIFLGNLFLLFLYQKQPWYSAIGASGGVSGILFATIAMSPNIELSFFFILPIKGFIFGLLYFAYSVYMMLNPKQYDNIGHAAHLGGAFFGLVYAIANNIEIAIENALYIGIMALPLIYLSYEIFINKRIR